MIQPYKQRLDSAVSEVIGYAPLPLIKNLPESNLTNFFADVMLVRSRSIPGVDTARLVALFNYGGLRTSIPRGEVRVGNIYEVMPFENQLVFVRLKGSELQTVLDDLAGKGGTPASGIRFEIANKKAENIVVHQQALDTSQIYTIATSDYLASGGDKFFTVDSPKEYTNTYLLLRDILIDHCKTLYKQNKTISGQTDGRISIAK